MNALVFGRRQQGKSTLAFVLAEEKEIPIAIFDINGQFCAWPEEVVSEVNDFAARLEESDLVIYRAEESPWEEFEAVADELWVRGEYVLLVDEASQVQSPGHAHPKLDRIVRMADAKNVHLIQTMHRPSDAAMICRSLATDWYIFRTNQETDLKVIAERCGPDVAAVAAELAPHEYVHWDDSAGIYWISKDPVSWFRNIHDTRELEAYA
ncbi:MAG TPA: hypothetical protein VGY31_03425 [Terriglobia bacterium]|nr:hypothetical protein [Terriglobia bacterium]